MKEKLRMKSLETVKKILKKIKKIRSINEKNFETVGKNHEEIKSQDDEKRKNLAQKLQYKNLDKYLIN